MSEHSDQAAPPQTTTPPAGPPGDGTVVRRPLPADLVPRIAPPASPAGPKPEASTPPPRKGPPRPSLKSENGAPVLVKTPPPFSIRTVQLLWVLSLVAGLFLTVYYFVIRDELLPLIADVARSAEAGRSDEAYEQTADIVFWIVFAIAVTTMLMQLTLLISFSSRKPRVRWWQLVSLLPLGFVLLLSPEWIAMGQRGESLQLLLGVQLGLAVLALLLSLLPGAFAWSTRQHDVRRGPVTPTGTDF